MAVPAFDHRQRLDRQRHYAILDHLVWRASGRFVKVRDLVGGRKEWDMLRASLRLEYLRVQRSYLAILAVCVVAGCLASSVVAAPPWATLVPFKKIDADPKKSY